MWLSDHDSTNLRIAFNVVSMLSLLIVVGAVQITVHSKISYLICIKELNYIYNIILDIL